jgi:hypothetical protein
MKKFIFLLGMIAGFVLGSRMGRGPYEQLEGSVREMIDHPRVQRALHSAAVPKQLGIPPSTPRQRRSTTRRVSPPWR